MPRRWVIGLSCGAGAAGLEAALLELSGVGLALRVEQIHGLRQPHPPDLSRLVTAVGSLDGDVRQASRLHRLLGEASASAARAAADGAGTPLTSVLCVGLAGHLAGHEPEGRFPATLSLGMAAVVAERCGVTTVSDFRERDVAAGGQGGPLSALPELLLFGHPAEARVVLHLGGMARLSYVPASARPGDVASVEAAPCNLLLDALVKHLTSGRESFDAGGKRAVQGRAIEPLVEAWLASPALSRRPPRSLPRGPFIDEVVRQALAAGPDRAVGPNDLLCSATHFVARAVAQAVRRYLPAEARGCRVLLAGGGARNGLLIQLLQQHLRADFGRTEEAGVPADLIDAASAGVLAALTLDAVAANVPGLTGAAGPRLLGSLTPGSSASWAKCVGWMARRV